MSTFTNTIMFSKGKVVIANSVFPSRFTIWNENQPMIDLEFIGEGTDLATLHKRELVLAVLNEYERILQAYSTQPPKRELPPPEAMRGAFKGHETPEEDTCEWKADEDGVWHTDCGDAFVIMNLDGPAENGFQHCPYCGRELREKPYEADQ